MDDGDRLVDHAAVGMDICWLNIGGDFDQTVSRGFHAHPFWAQTPTQHAQGLPRRAAATACHSLRNIRCLGGWKQFSLPFATTATNDAENRCGIINRAIPRPLFGRDAAWFMRSAPPPPS